jgi:hypothetical protein
MYDRIKEIVRKLNATILQYLERGFGCSWRLATWLPAHFAYYDVNILYAFVGKCARYFWKSKWFIHVLCKWLIFWERDIVEKLYRSPFRKIRLLKILFIDTVICKSVLMIAEFYKVLLTLYYISHLSCQRLTTNDQMETRLNTAFFVLNSC